MKPSIYICTIHFAIAAAASIRESHPEEQPRDCFGKREVKYEGFFNYGWGRLHREVSRVEVPTAEGILQTFFQRLISFVNETNFDFRGFECKNRELREDLEHFEEFYAKNHGSDSVLKQLSFTAKMLQVMEDGTRFMACYGTFNIMGHNSVYKAVELYVRAFALQNSSGALDLHKVRSGEKVLHLYRELWNLESEFKRLDEAPFYVALMFKDQSYRAKKTILGLIDQIPEEEDLKNAG